MPLMNVSAPVFASTSRGTDTHAIYIDVFLFVIAVVVACVPDIISLSYFIY